MAYLVDGHNLIPKMPDMSLEDIDDERQLIERLSVFCQKQRKRIELFFDNAPPGGVTARSLGWLTVRYVRAGRTADQAIHQRLRSLGREARNWIVVSSDGYVRAIAQAAHARTLTSEEFASMVQEALVEKQSINGEKPHPESNLSRAELEEWLQIFGGEHTEDINR